MVIRALHGLDRYRDLGLFLLRVGLGSMFVYHGSGKLFGGPDEWSPVGTAMENLGITFAPAFWGFMAGLSEFGGGLLLAGGFLFRPACLLLVCTMAVAATFHLNLPPDHPYAGFGAASHAIEAGIVFLSLLLIGPGKLSVDDRLWSR
jgi:putative oxidoreductase